jgi:hypothetical protein
LALSVLATVWPCALSAEERAVPVVIEAEAALALGPARLEVVVEMGDSREQPLMLDVASEGEALQVVRGRFRRADARLGEDGRLRFSVPIVVRAQGNAIVRTELRTYRCRESCREVRVRVQRTLTVGPDLGRSGNAP